MKTPHHNETDRDIARRSELGRALFERRRAERESERDDHDRRADRIEPRRKVIRAR